MLASSMFRRATLLVCDVCGREVTMSDEVFVLPLGWRPFYCPKTVGTFHACSEACAEALALKLRCPE